MSLILTLAPLGRLRQCAINLTEFSGVGLQCFVTCVIDAKFRLQVHLCVSEIGMPVILFAVRTIIRSFVFLKMGGGGCSEIVKANRGESHETRGESHETGGESHETRGKSHIHVIMLFPAGYRIRRCRLLP